MSQMSAEEWVAKEIKRLEAEIGPQRGWKRKRTLQELQSLTSWVDQSRNLKDFWFLSLFILSVGVVSCDGIHEFRLFETQRHAGI